MNLKNSFNNDQKIISSEIKKMFNSQNLNLNDFFFATLMKEFLWYFFFFFKKTSPLCIRFVRPSVHLSVRLKHLFGETIEFKRPN